MGSEVKVVSGTPTVSMFSQGNFVPCSPLVIDKVSGTFYILKNGGVTAIGGGVSLPVPVPNGGTGQTSFTATQLLIGNDVSPITSSANLTFAATSRLLIGAPTDDGTSQLQINGNTAIPASGRVIVGGQVQMKWDTTNNSIYFGNLSASGIPTGPNNTTLGAQTGTSLAAGSENTLLGFGAGSNINSGFENVCLGYIAGGGINTGQRNMCIGPSSGGNIGAGLNNILIGRSAGGNIAGGSDNICIGARSNMTTSGAASNRVVIGGPTGADTLGDTNNQVFLGNSLMTAWVPGATETVYLGRTDREFKGLYLGNGTNTTAGVAATINKATGRFRLSAGSTAFTLTNSEIAAGDTVICQPCMNDLTGVVKNTVPAAGSCVVNFVAPTADMDVMFQVIKN